MKTKINLLDDAGKRSTSWTARGAAKPTQQVGHWAKTKNQTWKIPLQWLQITQLSNLYFKLSGSKLTKHTEIERATVRIPGLWRRSETASRLKLKLRRIDALCRSSDVPRVARVRNNTDSKKTMKKCSLHYRKQYNHREWLQETLESD